MFTRNLFLQAKWLTGITTGRFCKPEEQVCRKHQKLWENQEWFNHHDNALAQCSSSWLLKTWLWFTTLLLQSLYSPWRHLGERRYSSYSFTTSALDGGEWSASRPDRALPPRKGPPVPIVQEAGWAPEPVWTRWLEEKSSAPAGDRTPIDWSSSP
jgi:hypothetical protein